MFKNSIGFFEKLTGGWKLAVPIIYMLLWSMNTTIIMLWDYQIN